MTFSIEGVHGQLKKRIDNAVTPHFKAFHTKYFVLDFIKGLMVIKKKQQDEKGKEISL